MISSGDSIEIALVLSLAALVFAYFRDKRLGAERLTKTRAERDEAARKKHDDILERIHQSARDQDEKRHKTETDIAILQNSQKTLEDRHQEILKEIREQTARINLLSKEIHEAAGFHARTFTDSGDNRTT